MLNTSRISEEFDGIDGRVRLTWPRRLPLVRVFGVIQLWFERAGQRRQLAELDDRMLKDVGITRADVYRESGKWFWQN